MRLQPPLTLPVQEGVAFSTQGPEFLLQERHLVLSDGLLDVVFFTSFGKSSLQQLTFQAESQFTLIGRTSGAKRLCITSPISEVASRWWSRKRFQR